MSTLRRAFATFLAALCLLLAAAADVDLSRVGSLQLTVRTVDGVPVEGAKVSLCRVAAASVVEGNLTFALVETLQGSGISLADLSDPSLADALYGQMPSDMPVETVVSDTRGKAAFSSLPTGLYLVFQEGFTRPSSISPFAPFLLSVPMTQDSRWVYAISASPKTGPDVSPTPPPVPTKPPSDPRLPQTGLLRWQVVSLATGGLALCGIGWALLLPRRKRDDHA